MSTPFVKEDQSLKKTGYGTKQVYQSEYIEKIDADGTNLYFQKD